MFIHIYQSKSANFQVFHIARKLRILANRNFVPIMIPNAHTQCHTPILAINIGTSII